MSKIAGINHLQAVRALKKAGFQIVRQGKKHIVMSTGNRFLTIPRNNPINAFTMSGIIREAGLTLAQVYHANRRSIFISSTYSGNI